MKQLCERRVQVLGSSLKSLMSFLSKKSMPCLHKRFVNPHLLMVLISSLGIFVFVIFSSAVILNFKMWSLKILLWFSYYLFSIEVLSRVSKNWCINVTKCSINQHWPVINCPIPDVISTFKEFAC